MTTYVAFLRGINVGGNNIVSMKALKESFAALGFEDVASYINSGNLLFRAKEKDARKLERKIDRMLADEHGLPGRTVVRSHAEMNQLVDTIGRTWKRPSADWRYYVLFLRHEVDSEDALGQLKPKPDIEEVVYCPGTLLWRARIADLTRSGVQKVASLPIYKEMTIRNLNTTRKVHDLMTRMAER
jgi:uncharacterized protein (DUF1697 family)